MSDVFSESFSVTAKDYTSAGEASAKIKGILKMLGIDPVLVRRVTIAAYEAEMNIVIHSHGGTMTLTITPNVISLECSDAGPGIANIDMAMQEGYSTASSDIRMLGFGAGMGLPNIKRNSDDFDIHSCQDGTCLNLEFFIK